MVPLRLTTAILTLSSCSVFTDPGSFERSLGSTPDGGSDPADAQTPRTDAPAVDASEPPLVLCDPERENACPSAQPFCRRLRGEDDAQCTECRGNPSDCATGTVCDIALGWCIATPGGCALDCEEGDACVVEAGAVRCERCDGDLDGERSCGLFCSGIQPEAGSCDCDDDGDGYEAESSACSPAVPDCDDGDTMRRPGLLACGGTAPGRPCVDPSGAIGFDPAPFASASAVSLRVGSAPLPDPLSASRIPVSLVITGPGAYSVFRPGGREGADAPFSRVERLDVRHSPETILEQAMTFVDAGAMAFDGVQHVVAERDDAGAVYLAVRAERMGPGVWLYRLDPTCDAGLCEVWEERPLQRSAALGPAIDLTFAQDTLASGLQPRVYFIEDRADVGTDSNVYLRTRSEALAHEIKARDILGALLAQWGQVRPGGSIAAYPLGVVAESDTPTRSFFVAWASPPLPADETSLCNAEMGCALYPLGPGAPEIFGGKPSVTPAGTPSTVFFGDGRVGSTDVAGFFPGTPSGASEALLYVQATARGCGNDPDGDGPMEATTCPELAVVAGVRGFRMHDAQTLPTPATGRASGLVAIVWDRPIAGAAHELVLSFVSVASLQSVTGGAPVEPVGELVLGEAPAELFAIDLDIWQGPSGTELAVYALGGEGDEPVAWIHALRFCAGP